MPLPSLRDLITLSSTANGLIAESLEERILSLLAMLASGTGPDGTPTGASGILTQTFTTSGTVTAPSWATYAEVICQGGGGSGGGGGTSATASLQGGGGGGAQSVPTRETIPITGGAVYTYTVGAGAASVAGGAAGGNPGNRGFMGGQSSLAIGGTILVACMGGGPGTFSAANSTLQGTGGWANSNASTSTQGSAGNGAQNGVAYWYLAGGGASAGGACTATNGGGSGQAYQSVLQAGGQLNVGVAGGSATTSGQDGQSTTLFGCGGGGGGGGNNNTGAGGAGGAGAAGKVTIVWRAT